jgi:hypothetical protein
VNLNQHYWLGKGIKLIFRNHYNRDLEYAKYRIGQSVTIYPQSVSSMLNSTFTGKLDRVIGINSVGDGIIEYCLDKYPYLLYDEQIQPLLLSPPQ